MGSENMRDLCGKYLGRDVRVVTIDSLLDPPTSAEIAHDLIFLWIADSLGVLEFKNYSAQLLKIAPVGIMVAGPEARKSFDLLIEAFDRPMELPHTMTSFSIGKVTDAVQQFFWSTWPSEDRFDEWRGYAIAGNENDHPFLEKVVREFLATEDCSK